MNVNHWILSWLALYLMACSPTLDAQDGLKEETGATTTAYDVPPCEVDETLPVRQHPDLQTFTFEDFPVFALIPPNPRALVFAFHGSGGQASFLNGIHPTQIWNAMYDAQIAVVGSESTDRKHGVWLGNDDLDENIDMQRMARLRDHLIATTEVEEDAPVFGWGFSNGGGFVGDFLVMADELSWPVAGGLIHNSVLQQAVDVPVWFTTNENDGITPSTKASAEQHAERGLDAPYVERSERSWQVDDMLLNPSYDEEESQAVFDELVAFEFIDASGARLRTLDNLEAAMRYYSNNSTLPGPDRVTTLLRVVWATHRTSGSFACEERDFVLRHLSR